jgi:GDSL-like Lipase/Acylhydrolase family
MTCARRGELLLAAASVAVTLAAAELVARASHFDRPRPTGYAPVNTDWRGPRPVNSRGYRDLEHTLAKPAGVHRLLVLGDSFAWGASIHFDDTFAERLQRTLTRLRQQPWEAVNLAVPGLNCVDEASQLATEGMAYSPDVVVVGYVLNDAESRDEMIARERGYVERDARPKSVFDRSALLRFVRSRLQATADARERVAYHRELYAPGDPGWLGAQRALREMGDLCRERGVPLVVAIFPLFGNPLDDSYPFADIHAKVAAVAEQAGARVVDLLPFYRGLDWRLLVVNGSKDEHPNEIAHRIAADAIERVLGQVVPWKPGR